MRYFFLIAVLTLFFSCKQSETTSENTSTIKETQTETVKETIPIKESLFLTMERTPCFGKCPNYKITIFNTGNVVYEGLNFVEKKGKYTKTLSQKQLKEIQDHISILKIFEMNDKYDSPITDIPSVHLFIVYNNQKKKILDRVNGPKELKQFEKLIDHLVIDDELEKLEIRD
ncbi:MAG: hypothetical protein COB15_15460 [Flavobacteriales bacterium]|nr:MAG: hypothetical protein COB15_15460 [Flavobacteriales bacterium]